MLLGHPASILIKRFKIGPCGKTNLLNSYLGTDWCGSLILRLQAGFFPLLNKFICLRFVACEPFYLLFRGSLEKTFMRKLQPKTKRNKNTAWSQVNWFPLCAGCRKEVLAKILVSDVRRTDVWYRACSLKPQSSSTKNVDYFHTFNYTPHGSNLREACIICTNLRILSSKEQKSISNRRLSY